MTLVPFTWALRDILSGKRALGLAALALIPGALMGLVVFTGVGSTPSQDTTGVVTTFLIPVVVGLIALVASGSVLRTPLQEGTIIYQLTRPVRRASLGLQRATAAAVTTALLTVLAAVPVAAILGTWELVLGAVPGLILAGLAFGALYGALVSLHRYALAVAVVHLVAETALARVAFPIHETTLTWHVWGLLGQITEIATGSGAIPAGGGSWWMPALVLLASLVVAAGIFRYRAFSLNVAEA